MTLLNHIFWGNGIVLPSSPVDLLQLVVPVVPASAAAAVGGGGGGGGPVVVVVPLRLRGGGRRRHLAAVSQPLLLQEALLQRQQARVLVLAEAVPAEKDEHENTVTNEGGKRCHCYDIFFRKDAVVVSSELWPPFLPAFGYMKMGGKGGRRIEVP